MLKLKPNNKINIDNIKQLVSCVAHWEYNWHNDFQPQVNMLLQIRYICPKIHMQEFNNQCNDFSGGGLLKCDWVMRQIPHV